MNHASLFSENTTFQIADFDTLLFSGYMLFMLIAVLIPLITFTVHFTCLMPVKNIDPTPFAFALSGMAMSVSILIFRMFDLMPIGREHIFRSMGDTLVVTDNKH